MSVLVLIVGLVVGFLGSQAPSPLAGYEDKTAVVSISWLHQQIRQSFGCPAAARLCPKNPKNVFVPWLEKLPSYCELR